MATRGSGKTDDRSNTRNASSAKKESAPNTGSNQQSRGAAPLPPNQVASTTRGDQPRELHTSRESGDVRQSQSAGGADLARSDLRMPFRALVSTSPFALMRRMMEDMDHLFGSWQEPHGHGLQRTNQRGGQQPSSLRNLWAPQVEVFERSNNIVVRAELPGLTKDDVDVEVEDDALIIRGERHNDVDDEREGYYRSERSYGSFYRAIPLPEGVDPTGCNATFKDGVLEVTLPKPTQQASKARKISVR